MFIIESRMIDEDLDDEVLIINLVNNQTNTILYKSLAEVDVNTWLPLAEYPNGLCSLGFSSCYAVIVRNTADPKKVALAHVSSIDTHCIEFVRDMVDAVSSDNQYIIELARSKQGYTEQYNDEYEVLGLQDTNAFFEKTGLIMPDVFFAETDPIYEQFFRDNFDIIPLIYEMPVNSVVINANGQLDFLEEHSGALEAVNPDQCVGPTSRNHNNFFYSEPVEDDQERKISKKLGL